MSNKMLAGEWPECETPEAARRSRRRLLIAEIATGLVVVSAVVGIVPAIRVIATVAGLA